MVPAVTQQIGASLICVIAEAGYHGHKRSGSKGYAPICWSEARRHRSNRTRLRRRAAVESVIGHLKEESRMGATIWPAGPTEPPMPSSPPPATPSGTRSCSSPSFGAPCCWPLSLMTTHQHRPHTLRENGFFSDDVRPHLGGIGFASRSCANAVLIMFSTDTVDAGLT